MTTQEFFDLWGGKGVDFDGSYGFQCMDLYLEYQKDVVGCPIMGAPCAKDVWNHYPTDYFDKIPNTPAGFPQKGDIVIWGMGNYGHIAICVSADVNQITSLDQNWPWGLDYNPHPSSVIHHNYGNVLGWLRPKNIQVDLPALPAGWNSADYLAANPDVANAGVDPVWHWQHWGYKENRQLHPAPPVVVTPPVVETPPIVEEPPVVVVELKPEEPVIPVTPTITETPKVPEKKNFKWLSKLLEYLFSLFKWKGQK